MFVDYMHSYDSFAQAAELNCAGTETGDSPSAVS
jgi:hypothetical protein